VSRHAPASSAKLTVDRGSDELHFEVADDGSGFDLDADVRADALGLAGMRERARLLDGRLSIGPREGGGTLVRLDIPVG
jgi:signal transduction histidine kinase